MSQIINPGSGGGGGGGIITIQGDVGSVTGGVISFNAEPTCGSSVSFSGTGTTMRLFVTDLNSNTIVGNNSGNGTISGTNNTSFGKDALIALTSGSGNIAIGIDAMTATTAGSNNIVIGGGDANVNNIGNGNIVIGSPVSFAAATANTTLIGNASTTKCVIGGINGVSLGNTITVVTMGGSDPDELGTANIVGSGGVSVSASANTITISGSGSGVTWNEVTGGSATLAASNGYVINNAGATILTLPTNSLLGDTIQIVGRLGIWAIIYGTGQYIQFGRVSTTTSSGQLNATEAHDCVTLICTIPSVTSPVFSVVNSVGNMSLS